MSTGSYSISKPKGAKPFWTARRQTGLKMFLLVLPMLALVFVFSYLPLLGWCYAFADYVPGRSVFALDYVGLTYFKMMFSGVGYFPTVMRNTLVLSLAGILLSPLPAILAIMVTQLSGGWTGRFQKTIQTATSLPNFISWVLVYSLFFADKFDKLQDNLKSIYASGKSEEDIAYDVMELLDDFYSGIGSNMDAAEAWMEEFAKRAEEMGYELWKPDSTTQSGKAGAFTTTMTQDQGTKLEGLMTSLQMHGASVDDKMDDIAEGLGASLDALNRIAKNTDTLPQILALWQAIKRDGLKAK